MERALSHTSARFHPVLTEFRGASTLSRVETVKRKSPSASRRWKQDREDYFASLRRHRIGYLLHYTPVDNLESIFETGGLLSRKQQAGRRLSPRTVHGWGRKWKALEDYICLCFEPPLGLLQREKSAMAALIVRPEVVGLRDSLFCPMNSARSWIDQEEILSRCDLESFEDLFREPDAPALKNHESEVLIRGRLGLWAVRRIVLPNAETSRRLRRLRVRCLWFRIVRRRKFPRWSIDRYGDLFL